MRLIKLNTKIKILSIVGARPQIIKAATLSRYIQNSSEKKITEIIVHTGQHYDSNMSDVFFKEMRIPEPKYNLKLGGGNHGEMTGKIILELEKVFVEERPDWVIVYGDTNSTLAAAIVASKLDIKIAHIEAGLRSYKMTMPEEINRALTDRVSNLLFCPTENAVKNLLAEGYNSFSNTVIKNVGDIMYESILHFSGQSKKPSVSFDLEKNSFVLATIHRAEVVTNKNKLTSVISALNTISESTKIVAPFHPRTIESIKKYKINLNFNVLPPVSYLEMLWLIDNSKIVLTDSGGLQKEAFFLKKVCLIAREETEWVELLRCGNSVLIGYDTNKIISEYNKTRNFYSTPNLFGDGNSSEQIINSIINYSKT